LADVEITEKSLSLRFCSLESIKDSSQANLWSLLGKIPRYESDPIIVSL
jgi:hypothetical protein